MKNLAIFSLIILFLGSLTSCRSTKPTVVKEYQHDTIMVETKIIERDTVIVTEKANVSTTIDKSVFQDDLKPFSKEVKHKNAKLSLKKVGNEIIADCQCDTLSIIAKLKDKYKREKEVKYVEKVEEIQVKYTPLMVKILAWVGAVFLIILIIGIILKIQKPI